MLRRPIEFKKAMLDAKHEYEREVAGGDADAPARRCAPSRCRRRRPRSRARAPRPRSATTTVASPRHAAAPSTAGRGDRARTR